MNVNPYINKSLLFAEDVTLCCLLGQKCCHSVLPAHVASVTAATKSADYFLAAENLALLSQIRSLLLECSALWMLFPRAWWRTGPLCLMCPVVSCCSSSSTWPFPSKISRKSFPYPFDVQPPSLSEMTEGWDVLPCSSHPLSPWPGVQRHSAASKQGWKCLTSHIIPTVNTHLWTHHHGHAPRSVATSCTLFSVHHTMPIPNTPGTQKHPRFLPHLPPQSGNE